MNENSHPHANNDHIDETDLRLPFLTNENNRHHYAVGRQIHTDQYYYEKYYFQLQLNGEKMAGLLFNLLKSGEFPLSDITLLGMGAHCGHFLSETVRLLKLNSSEESDPFINYAVLENTGTEYSFLFTPIFNKNILIILPLTFTFSRCFEIIDYLNDKEVKDYKRSPDITFSVYNQFITLFLVADTNLGLDKLPNDSERIEISSFSKFQNSGNGSIRYLKDLYSAFGWDYISREGLSFVNNGKYRGFKARYIHYLKATLYPAEYCQYCFPQEPNQKEISLFPTRRHYDTPNVIFDLPRFKNTIGELSDISFKEVFEKHYDPGHLYGHLKLESNSYLHYIERDRFYLNNKQKILDFFKEKFQINFPELNQSNANLMVITPINPKSSTILEDMLDFDIFPKKRTFIIYTDPNNEFIENFLNNNLKNLVRYSTILYFDYVISGGKGFKVISDYLKYVNPKGFNGMFTLIDRTTRYSKLEILRKLTTDENDANNFISFFKLNIPLLDATNSGNPIEEKNERLTKMFEYCHLDGLKVEINKELKRGQPRTLAELKLENTKYDDATRYYNLLKLKISHEIAILLTASKKNKFTTHELDIDEIIERIKQKIFLEGNFEKYKDCSWLNQETIKLIIVKNLAYAPFKFYEKIYANIFQYVRKTLIQLADNLKRNDFKLKSYDEIIQYRFYLKMCVQLNGNFMFSTYFFRTLRGVYEERQNSEKKFLQNVAELMILVKQSIFQNAARTIKLEKFLNNPDYLPKPIQYPDLPIRETLNDPFYLIGRLLKAENTYILDELKKHFLQALDSKKELKENYSKDINKIRQYIRDAYFSPEADLTDRVIRNLKSFLLSSRDSTSATMNQLPDAITSAVEQMLVTIFKLETSSVQPHDFLKEAKDIISEACQIIGSDIEFSFCIEFSGVSISTASIEEFANNLYIISSHNERQHRRIHKNGLINQMLYGLNEVNEKNLQTFLAVIKDSSGDYISFRNDYYSTDINRKNLLKLVSINDSFGLDIINGDVGIVPVDSEMNLLLRFSEMTVGADSPSFGKAVLVLSSKNKPTTKSLTDFLHVERIRLLLLIKKQMLAYLNRQFENEAFIDLVTRRDNAILMTHGLNDYKSAALSYITNDSQLNLSEKEAYSFVLNKMDKLYRSMLSFVEGGDEKPSLINEYNDSKIRELFQAMAKLPFVARRPLKQSEWKLQLIMDGPLKCEPEIYNIVIPEIFVNMRRASLDITDENVIYIFKIEFSNNILTFENMYNPNAKKLIGIYKPNGGLAMCNAILKRYGYPPLKIMPVSSNNTNRARTILRLDRL